MILRKVNKQQAFQVLMEERMAAGETYIDAMTEYMVEHQLEAKQVAKLMLNSGIPLMASTKARPLQELNGRSVYQHES